MSTTIHEGDEDNAEEITISNKGTHVNEPVALVEPHKLYSPLSIEAKDDDSRGDGNVSKELFTEGQKSPINSFLKKIHLDKNVFHFHDMTTKHKNIFYSRLGDVMIAFLLFGALTFMLGFDFMLYGGAGWSVFLLWFCSLTAGTALKKVKVPPLLGNLIVGLILKNMPGKLVDGLPADYAAAIRSTGLSLILMRSGLELDIPAVARQGWIAARLTVCPGFIEAMAIGGTAVSLWGFPPALGFSLGFILAAVSPAVVVGGMFDLQKRGYGIAKGIPSLVVAAASFDDVVAISGYSIAIGFAIQSGGNKVWEALAGPTEVIIGVIVGVTGGTVCGMSRIFSSGNKRWLVCLLMGFFQMYIASRYHASGAGALSGLVTTITASYVWQNNSLNDYNFFKWLGVAQDKRSHEWHHETEHVFATLWDKLASPLLFASIGASIDFAKLDMKIIPDSLLIVFVGMCVRVPTAFLVTGGKNLSFLERLFVGLAWIPKATVQAALGSVPLDLIMSTMDKSDPEFENYKSFGEKILVTAVVAILVTAPIGLICISTLGDRWLNDDIKNPIHDPEAETNKKKKLAAIEDQLTGVNSGTDTSANPAGTVKAERQRSFIGVAADYFDKIIGGGAKDQAASGEIENLSPRTNSRVRSASLARRTATAGIIAEAARNEDWVLAEQRKRMSVDDVRNLNKRLSAHYFHNLTNHVEFISTSIEAILSQDASAAGNHLKSTTNTGNREEILTDLLSSTAKIMQGSMACYKVIASMEENFPVEKLYSFIGSTEDDLDRKAERAVYDYISGEIVVDRAYTTSNSDPIQDTLTVLERRDTNVTLTRARFGSSENATSA